MVPREGVTHNNKIEYNTQTIKSTSLPQHPIYILYSIPYISDIIILHHGLGSI